MYKGYGTLCVRVLPSLVLFVSLGATVLYNIPASFGGILLDNLRCTGRETRLIDCPHNGLNIHNCVHPNDVGVRCITSPTRKCVPSQLYV